MDIAILSKTPRLLRKLDDYLAELEQKEDVVARKFFVEKCQVASKPQILEPCEDFTAVGGLVRSTHDRCGDMGKITSHEEARGVKKVLLEQKSNLDLSHIFACWGAVVSKCVI